MSRWYGQSRYNGGFGDPLDKILMHKYFSNQVRGHAVEAGAGDGVWLSTTKAFEDIGWDCTNIEATMSTYEQLKKNRPLAKNINFALWDKQGELLIMDCYEESGLNGISFLPKHEMMKAHKPINHEPVETCTYSELIHRPVDLFVLDVEGAEVKVIRGMAGSPFLPRVFCIEHSHVGKEELDRELRPRGYVLDWYDEMNGVWVL